MVITTKVVMKWIKKKQQGNNMKLKLFIFGMLVFGIGIFSNTLMASIISIVATVNDEMISTYDLNARLNLVQTMIGPQPISAEDFKKKILDTLIEEKLKLQEARRLNVTVSKKEVEQAFSMMAKQNRMTGAGLEHFLKTHNISSSVLKDQIYADLSWMQVIRQRIIHTININETDIQEQKEMMEEQEKLTHVSLAQLLTSSQNWAEKVFAQVKDVQGCDLFVKKAHQLGLSGSGRMGWFSLSSLSVPLQQILPSLKQNTVSPPVQVASGMYVLLMICDQKTKKVFEKNISEETIKDIVFNERVMIAAEKYLRNLKRAAIVDYKNKN